MSISRRIFLNRIGVVSAAAAVVTIPPACTVVSDDAELVELGAEFDRVYASLPPLHREANRINAQWRQTILARGMSFAGHGNEACCALHKELGGEKAEDAQQAVLDVLDGLAARIRALRPTSIAGLASWAKAARFDALSLGIMEQKPDDRDWGDKHLVAFFEEVERLALSADRAAS
jgi:hypothetical protein